MAQEVRAVISRAKGEPVEVTTIVVPDPGPGEALVDIKACGVCHTDLHYKVGAITDDFPFLLGHEAAGVVEAVGEDVTEVVPGDFVFSTGGRPVAIAERAGAAGPGIASARSTPRSR